MLLCGDKLPTHLRAAAADLAHRTSECYSRPYLDPSLRDRTLCMLGAAVEGVAQAGAISGAASLEDAAAESQQQQQRQQQQQQQQQQLAVELAAALSEGGFAENLAAYAQLCCVWWWDEEGGSSNGGPPSVRQGDQGAEDDGAYAARRTRGAASALSAQAWAAAARAELAAKTLGLAAALMAQQEGAVAARSGTSGSASSSTSSSTSSSRRRARVALSKLIAALCAAGNRYASSPLPGPSACGSAAAAAERRMGALRALQSLAAGLSRAVAAVPLEVLLEVQAVGSGEAAVAAAVSWVGAVVREAAAAQGEDGVAASARRGSGGVLVHVDWDCLDALLSLLVLLQENRGGGCSSSCVSVQLPSDLLIALFPAALEAARWTMQDDGLVEVARCLKRLWGAAVDASETTQVRRPFVVGFDWDWIGIGAAWLRDHGSSSSA